MDLTQAPPVQPLVSILIPTYRRARFLVSAICSAREQSLSDIEILVLDDCSPDDTPQVVRRFLGDPRVRHIRHPKNLGIAENWRRGIEFAKGTYFCILHDDDTLESTFLEKLVQPLEKDDSLILSFCDQWFMDSREKRLLQRSSDASRGYRRDRFQEGPLVDFARAALIDDSIPAGASVYRTRMIKPGFVDNRARGSIDMWLLYQCFKTGGGAYYVPERLMNYREHDGGMVRSMPFEMIEGHLFRYRSLLEDNQLAPLYPELREKLATALEWLGMALLRSKQFEKAREPFMQAAKITPTAKAYLGLALSFGGNAGLFALDLFSKLRPRR